ncbi:MAG: hypothetical protein ABR588_00685 [Sphingomicrobium sp.]|nr:hypothetical protein [Sphingomonadales bacterium]
MTKRSREALQEFLDYLGDKGLMAKATAHARKAAANKILGILSEEEASDVTAIDLDDVIHRFSNLHGKKYTPQSLVTYKSRLRSALDDFDAYIANPLAFRPSLQRREPRTKEGRGPASLTNENGAQAGAGSSARAVHAPLAASNILPVPLRSDLTVHIQGLPFDLSAGEAKKLANIIMAMAMPLE